MPNRRTFLATTIGAVVAAALPALPLPAAPLPPPENYWCPCGLVQYFRKPERHFATSHIFIDGKTQRFNYGLHMRHLALHRKLDIGTGKA
jgi:hypothetical protein